VCRVLQRCIRAPNVTLSPLPSFCCCCCSPVPCMDVLAVQSSIVSLPACLSACTGELASCVSWVQRQVHPPPHAPLNSTAFPPTFWPGETPLPTYSCSHPYLIILPPPHCRRVCACSCFLPLPSCWLLAFTFSLLLPVATAVVGSSQLLLPRQSNIRHQTSPVTLPHTCRRI